MLDNATGGAVGDVPLFTPLASAQHSQHFLCPAFKRRLTHIPRMNKLQIRFESPRVALWIPTGPIFAVYHPRIRTGSSSAHL
jgi:hypothetical protein